MNTLSSVTRRFVGGGIIAAFLLGVAAVPEAGAPQSAQGGARLFQGGGQGSGATDSKRMVVLLFDANGFSLSEAQTVTAGALQWLGNGADLTSIVTTGPKLTVWSDFTADRAELGTLLRSEAFLNAIVEAGPGPQPIRFGRNDSVQNPDAARADPQLAEQRIRGIKTVCETVSSISSRKAIIYFSKNLGVTRDQTFSESLRAATTACNRANVTLNPIDPRGLAAAVPGPASRP